MANLPVVDIYVTGACNLACGYCFGEDDRNPAIEPGIFSAALELASTAGATAIEFCGGEPLLYRDLEWAVGEAQRMGFKTIMRTNGLLLEGRLDFISSNFDAVAVSVDGDAETNAAMRPSKGRSRLSASRKLTVALSAFSALRGRNSSIELILASVATAKNLAGLEALANLLVTERISIDLWKIYQFVGNNFRAAVNNGEYAISAQEFAQLAAKVSVRVDDHFRVTFRASNDTESGCVIVTSGGNVRLGGTVVGDLRTDSCLEIIRSLVRGGLLGGVEKNKMETYRGTLWSARNGR